MKQWIILLLTLNVHNLTAQKYLNIRAPQELTPKQQEIVGEDEYQKFSVIVSQTDWKSLYVKVTTNDTIFTLAKPLRNLGDTYEPNLRGGKKVPFGYITSSHNRDKFFTRYVRPWNRRKFLNKVYFSGVELDSFYVDFGEFRDELVITYSKFHGGFSNTVFKGNFTFNNNHGKSFSAPEANFTKSVGFSENKFDELNFWFAKFNGPVSISQITVKNANFRGAKFLHGTTNFERVKLTGTADFSQATFTNGDVFSGVTLPDTLYFSNVTFNMPPGELFDFRRTNNEGGDSTNKRCVIYIYGTDLSKIILPADRFILYHWDYKAYGQSKEYFQESITSKYETLIKNCKNAGMEQSARDWDIYLKKLRCINTWGWRIGQILNTINEYWWKFGYEKRYILLGWLPGFFVVFLLINYVFLAKWILSFYKDDELGKNFGLSPDDQNNHRRFSYIFFLTAILYFGLKIKHSAVDYRNKGGVLYLYLMYMIGSIHVAFAFSYILNIY